MITPSDEYWGVNLNLTIEGVTRRVQFSITEAGLLELEVDSNYGYRGRPSRAYDQVTGVTDDGNNVVLKNVFAKSIDSHHVTGKRSGYEITELEGPTEATIDGCAGYTFVNETTTFEFDLLCFNPDIGTTQTIARPLLKKTDWEASAINLATTDERIDFIKTHKTPIITAKIQIQQEVNGGIDRQIRTAKDKVLKLLELLSFAQGVKGAPIKAELKQVDGDPVDNHQKSLEFIRIFNSRGACDIGSNFTGHNLVHPLSQPDYLEDVYDNYTRPVRNDLQLKHIIGYYVDSINSTRTIEGQFMTLCNTIELFALRNAGGNTPSGGTKGKIKKLVNDLQINTSDLVSMSGTYDSNRQNTIPEHKITEKIKKHIDGTQISIFDSVSVSIDCDFENQNTVPEYFYYKSRNYLAHGAPRVSSDDLWDDYRVTLVLLQRAIRNQLFVGNNYPEYIDDIEPISLVEF